MRTVAAHALDDADEVGIVLPRRHEVDRASRCRSRSSNSVSSTSVSSRYRRCVATIVAAGREQPAPVRARRRASAAKHAGESKRGKTEPVDRAVAADERGGLRVADQRVVLDAHVAIPLVSRAWRY